MPLWRLTEGCVAKQEGPEDPVGENLGDASGGVGRNMQVLSVQARAQHSACDTGVRHSCAYHRTQHFHPPWVTPQLCALSPCPRAGSSEAVPRRRHPAPPPPLLTALHGSSLILSGAACVPPGALWSCSSGACGATSGCHASIHASPARPYK